MILGDTSCILISFADIRILTLLVLKKVTQIKVKHIAQTSKENTTLPLNNPLVLKYHRLKQLDSTTFYLKIE